MGHVNETTDCFRPLGWSPRTVLACRSLCVAFCLALGGGSLRAEPTIWRMDDPAHVAGTTTLVLGNPRVRSDGLEFDGARDGIFVPLNPLADWAAFTIEILFRPDESGGAEQRFVHIEDSKGSRVMMETRLDGKGHWWLDTFLRDEGASLPLIDPQRTHPTGAWYWAAVRYDGKTKTMSHFVNGEKEREGAVVFRPMTNGQTSIGVRQNRVFWYKGLVREIRFHPEALPPEQLQRTP